MTIDRTKLIQAAEAAYQQEKAREAEFRTWLCAHLGPQAGAQEALIIAKDASELSVERLALVVMFDSGCPPGYSLSAEQVEMAARAALGLGDGIATSGAYDLCRSREQLLRTRGNG
jgi:hypothetical protein